jgi:hypothetical protein
MGGRDAAADEVAVIGECAWSVCEYISCTGDADLNILTGVLISP